MFGIRKPAPATPATYANDIHKLATLPECAANRDSIHMAARISQVFFSTGFVLSSTVGICAHFHPLLSGGSFFLHGYIVFARIAEAALCYDLARVSSNVASIFHSQILSNTARKRLGSSPIANIIVNALIRFENWSKLPQNINMKNPTELTHAVTDGTFIANQFNPYIKDFLSTPISKISSLPKTSCV